MGYAIYCRISSDPRGEGAGVQRQEDECRKLAEIAGLDVDHVYTDNDISAFSGADRPAYEEMLTALRKREHQGVICWHVDRLYRRIRDLEEIVELVEATGVEVRTVKAGDLDLNTATGRVTARLVAAIANYEVDHQIERQLASQSQRAAQGLWRGGRAPYGYRLVKGENTLEIVPEEAEHLRWMAERVLDGASMFSIVRDLNRRGVTTNGGKKWRVNYVRRVLLTPTVTGISAHHGEEVGQGVWPAILDEETWRSVKAILTDPARSTTQGQERRWQGSGVYRCGNCGSKMRHTARKRRDGTYLRSYACVECHKVTRNLESVDDLVDGVILSYLDRPDNRLTIIEGETIDETELSSKISERAALVERRTRLASLYANGTLDEAQLVEGTTEFDRRIEAIDQEIAVKREASPLIELVLSGEALSERWGTMTPDQRAMVIDTLLSVTILPVQKRGPGFDPASVRIERKHQ